MPIKVLSNLTARWKHTVPGGREFNILGDFWISTSFFDKNLN